MPCKIIETVCDYCGKDFFYTGGQSHFERHVNHFCSRKCSHLNQKLYNFNPLKDVRYRMLSGAKRRAKVKGFDFNLTLEDIPTIPKFCPVLGIELKVNIKAGPVDSSPSLDRIDNSRGYVKGNVRVISNRANTLKRDATVEELSLVLQDLINTTNTKNLIV